MRNKQSKHNYFSDFGEGCEGILSVSGRHDQLPDDIRGERKQALADYLSDPNNKDKQKAVEYHVYRKYMNDKPDFEVKDKGFFIDGKGSLDVNFSVTISGHAALRMDERCIDKRNVKSRIKSALNQLRRKSIEINHFLSQGGDVRSILREYKNILSIQSNTGRRTRIVLKDRGFKLFFETSEIAEVKVGRGSAPVFLSKNGLVKLDLITLMYDVKRFSPISDAEIMRELSISTHREDCIKELRRELVFLSKNADTPILNFEVQLPNLQTSVEVRMEDEGEEALAYFLAAHKNHITDYLIKADTYVGLGDISSATEMLDEDEIVEAVSPFIFLNIEETSTVDGIVVPTEIMVEIDPDEYEDCINELFEEGLKVKSITPKKFASEVFSALSDEEKEEVYDKWHDLINMSQSSLNEWAEDDDRLLASINREEAKDAGNIQSGYDSFHRIKRRKEKPFENWSNDDFDNAKQEIGFNSRMLGGKPGQPVEDSGMSKWEISLKNWGHDPSLKSSPQHEKWKAWHNSHNTKKASIARVVSVFLNKGK